MARKTGLLRVLLILFFMLHLRAASAQETSLRAVYNALSGVMAPIWVAQDAGLFAKHGVNVDLKYLAATTAVQGMLGGGEEIGLVGNQGIDAKLEGADLIYVASGLPVFVFQVYGRSEIKSLADVKGKVVAVTFIYSRCPLPDYCPRMIENFRAVRQRFEPRMAKELVLLTISFDPKYDTPDILSRYARSQRAGGPGWHFLTGDPADIERVCNAFGIEYWPEEGLIAHTLQTAVIDREGKLAATVEGKDFTPEQLGDLVGAVLDR